MGGNLPIVVRVLSVLATKMPTEKKPAKKAEKPAAPKKAAEKPIEKKAAEKPIEKKKTEKKIEKSTEKKAEKPAEKKSTEKKKKEKTEEKAEGKKRTSEDKPEEKPAKLAKKEKPAAAAAAKKPIAKTAKAKAKTAKVIPTPKIAPKQKILKFAIDCKAPIEDGIFQIADFEKFMIEHFKINGKKGPNPALTIEVNKHKLIVSTVDSHYSKKYLKYLAKKYMKKQNLRDWLRVVAPNNSKDTYELRYFNINNEEDEEDDNDE